MKKDAPIHGLTREDFNDLQQSHFVKFRSINKNFIRSNMRPRIAEGHKGSFGHVLMIAGSEGTYGAAILACKAALKTGCGLLTACVPPGAVLPLICHLPEAMTSVRDNAEDVFKLDLEKYDAIGFGPGVGVTQDSQNILNFVLQHYRGPVVIDADGISILAQYLEMIEMLGENIILTPHPGEFSRIAITGSSRRESLHAQLEFYKKHRSTILVKGKNTTVVTQQGAFYNTTGNNGMATAGSGDVLTGIITSLCAQDYTCGDAALVGTFLHGYAGDIAAGENSVHSLVASDIIQALPGFFKKFEK